MRYFIDSETLEGIAGLTRELTGMNDTMSTGTMQELLGMSNTAVMEALAVLAEKGADVSSYNGIADLPGIIAAISGGGAKVATGTFTVTDTSEMWLILDNAFPVGDTPPLLVWVHEYPFYDRNDTSHTNRRVTSLFKVFQYVASGQPLYYQIGSYKKSGSNYDYETANSQSSMHSDTLSTGIYTLSDAADGNYRTGQLRFVVDSSKSYSLMYGKTYSWGVMYE